MRGAQAVLLVTCLASRDAVAVDGVEAGNDVYRVLIDKAIALRPARRGLDGFFTAWTGGTHPVTTYLQRPGEVFGMARECVTCAGPQDLAVAVVRSYSARVDHTLGANPAPGFFRSSEPGFTCINANDASPPLVEPILTGPFAGKGVRARWLLAEGAEVLDVEEILQVHGDDAVDGAVEFTLHVTNAGTGPVRVGLRAVWNHRISSRVTPSNPAGTGTWGNYFIGIRPPDPPSEPFTLVETEWVAPSFRMWQAHGGSPEPSVDPQRYSIATAVSGPWTLQPPPTPPDLLQQAVADYGGTASGGGSLNECFSWSVPEPPRDARGPFELAMTSYWGPTNEQAIELPPGGEVAVTQYLVAFIEYPLAADAGGPYEAPCEGPVTAVALSGTATLTEPSGSDVEYRWSSPDPRVSFTDPTDPLTSALVQGIGTFPVQLTAAIGAFAASAEATVTVTDLEAPVFTALSARPAVMWPPNHRLVEVCVDARVEDACDPSPVLRMISVRSDEPANDRGDGNTEHDILEADIGADDRCVLLRAERSGRFDGRTYTLSYEAEDDAGNVAQGSVEVVVPRDMRRAARPPAVPWSPRSGRR
jgi:hypothetical protein